MELTIEDKLVLAGSKLHLSENDIRQIEEMIPLVKDWNYFTENAIQNGAGPLLYKNFQQTSNSHLIPVEFIAKFKHSYYRSLSRNMILYEHFRNAVNLFSKEGIEVVALKGIFMAEAIYGDIGLRQMSDIDLLLKDDEVEQAWNILKDCGYQYKEFKKTEFITGLNDHKHLPQLSLNGVAIELHFKTHIEFRGFSVNMKDYWERSQPVILSGVKARRLCYEHQIQHSCLHLDEHFNDGKPQIYAFIDIAELIQKYSSEIDWQYFDESSRSYNCDDVVFKYLFLLNKYFDVKFPDFIIRKAEKIIDARAEKLFIHYLQHYRKDLPIGIANRNYEILNHVSGLKNKLRYLKDDIFPSKVFMIKRYEIKNKRLLIWYYFKRILKGIETILVIILKKFIPSATARRKKN